MSDVQVPELDAENLAGALRVLGDFPTLAVGQKGAAICFQAAAYVERTEAEVERLRTALHGTKEDS